VYEKLLVKKLLVREDPSALAGWADVLLDESNSALPVFSGGVRRSVLLVNLA